MHPILSLSFPRRRYSISLDRYQECLLRLWSALMRQENWSGRRMKEDGSSMDTDCPLQLRKSNVWGYCIWNCINGSFEWLYWMYGVAEWRRPSRSLVPSRVSSPLSTLVISLFSFYILTRFDPLLPILNDMLTVSLRSLFLFFSFSHSEDLQEARGVRWYGSESGSD